MRFNTIKHIYFCVLCLCAKQPRRAAEGAGNLSSLQLFARLHKKNWLHTAFVFLLITFYCNFMTAVHAADFCDSVSAPNIPEVGAVITTHNIKTNPFNSIIIDGPFFGVVKRSTSNQLKITSSLQVLNLLEITTVHDQLIIRQRCPAMQLPPITLEISLPQLRSFSMLGHSSIQVLGFSTQPSALICDGNAQLQVAGNYPGGHLEAGGFCNIRANAINANDLVILAQGHAVVSVSGWSRQLLVRASGHATIKAATLISNIVWAQGFDQAVLYTSPQESLRTFAYGQSQIFFNHHPSFLSRTTRDAGNVLFLG